MLEYLKKASLCLLSAILLILTFPKPNLAFLAWFALLPWFFTLRQEKPLARFMLSYLVGIAFFSGVIYWINYVSSLGFVVLIFYLALYFAAFGLIFPSARSGCSGKKRSYFYQSAGLVSLAAIWVSLEYLRSHLFSGFGWAALGYSQYLHLPVIQISDLTGVYGVSFLIVLVNVALWHLLGGIWESRRQKTEDRRQRCWAFVLFALFSLILAISYGYFRLGQPVDGDSVKVAVIQGNIPQKLKWDPQAQDYILARYAGLTRQAAATDPEIIIWPETAVPGFLETDQQLKQEISALSEQIYPSHLLLGTPHYDPSGKTYNRASLLLKGKIVQRYDKIHLVPFGEFIPLPEVFGRLPFAGLIGEFSPGKNYTIFKLPRNPQDSDGSTNLAKDLVTAGEGASSLVKFASLICFEDVFAGLTRRFVQQGAQVLVNMTNDAWFKGSAEPYQHLQASVLRAVENRVNVVRSANTGISCFINAQGKIINRVKDDSGQDLLVQGEQTQQLQLSYLRSFYTAFGDCFAWICLLLSAAFIVKGLLAKAKHDFTQE